MSSLATCDPVTNPAECCAGLDSLGADCVGTFVFGANEGDATAVEAL